MELWIRSQNKRVLVKINDIRLNILDNKEILGNFIRITDTQNDYEKLGTYATKERALEVLDEIQNQLMKKDKNNTELTYEIVNMANNEEKIIILKQCDLLYKMPKE